MADNAVLGALVVVATGAGLAWAVQRAGGDQAQPAQGFAPVGRAPDLMTAFGGFLSELGYQGGDVPPVVSAGINGALSAIYADQGGAGALLDLIGRAEAPGGYDAVHGAIPQALRPPRPLTQMRVSEVIAWQKSIRSRVVSTAAGRYQMIYDTLGWAADRLGARSWTFNAVTQDALAMELLRRRGWDEYQAGRLSWSEFGLRLAQEWAGLPVPTGPSAGQSYYAGTAGNAATVSVAELRAVLAPGNPGAWV